MGSRGGVGWYMFGVDGLFGEDADGVPSSVVQPPLLKEDVGGGISGAGGSSVGGSGGVETVAHPDFLKPLPDDELLTADQPPPANPSFFSGGAGIGSVPGAGVVTTGFCTVLTMGTTGVTVLSFTPAALAAFCNSFASLFLSFSLRFSIASWELVFARSIDCISLNRILWWWAYELQCSSYWATFWNCLSHTVQ